MDRGDQPVLITSHVEYRHRFAAGDRHQIRVRKVKPHVGEARPLGPPRNAKPPIERLGRTPLALCKLDQQGSLDDPQVPYIMYGIGRLVKKIEIYAGVSAG